MMYYGIVASFFTIITATSTYAEDRLNKNELLANKKVLTKGLMKTEDKVRSYIVACNEENSVEVLEFQIFDPPIYTVGGEVVGKVYKEEDFSWWNAQATVYKFDKLSYKELLSFFTKSYQKLVPLKEYEQGIKNIEKIKKEKETIKYAFVCSYKGDKFLFLGTGLGHLKDPFQEQWLVSVFKYVDEQWKWYAASPKDYDGSNLIFLLPLTNLKQLTKLIKSKIWQKQRFKGAFKNDLENIDKAK